MKTTYDLYGARDLDLSLAKNCVEEMLGVSLEERDSLYHGGTYYMWGDSNSEHFILKVNLDPFDEEPVEQNFQDFSILLYINSTGRSSDIEKIVRQNGCFELLRHEVL
jgi:hypothetical protein